MKSQIRNSIVKATQITILEKINKMPITVPKRAISGIIVNGNTPFFIKQQTRYSLSATGTVADVGQTMLVC